MSASLVGSEMCIRDSTGVAWAGPFIARLIWAVLAGLVWSNACTGRSSFCLLYTSDAADDM
eukprot:15145491-Alexandrium_andersonii.AAC.1